MGMLMLLAFTGCQKNSEPKAELAFVTDGDDVQGDIVNQSIWTGVEQFAKESKKECQSYVPEERSDAAYEKTIDQAVKKGAEVIVCAGEEMETALYQAQREYRDIRFLLMDGVPVDEDGKERLRGNTLSIEIAPKEAGYLAGYAAVQAGYTNLGYLGGADEKKSREYGTGFALGINEAAKDLGLSSENITLKYRYRGTDGISPEFLAEVENWYREGCQVMFTDGGSYSNVVTAAAEKCGGAIIWNGGSSTSSSVVMTVRMEYGNILYETLKAMEQNEFEGKTHKVIGVRDGGISLEWNQDVLSAFTGEKYVSIRSKMSKDDFSIKEGDALENPDAFAIANLTVEKFAE